MKAEREKERNRVNSRNNLLEGLNSLGGQSATVYGTLQPDQFNAKNANSY